MKDSKGNSSKILLVSDGVIDDLVVDRIEDASCMWEIKLWKGSVDVDDMMERGLADSSLFCSDVADSDSVSK